MATMTYTDVYSLINDGSTQQIVEVACLRTAYNVSNEDPAAVNHSGRLQWANTTLANPVTAAANALRFVLAGVYQANAGNLPADLNAFKALLTEQTIQNFVDASLAIFAPSK